MSTNSRNQDILFDLLERNDIQEVQAYLVIDQWGRDSLNIHVFPKCKFAVLYEPVIEWQGDGTQNERGSSAFENTVSGLIWCICDTVSWEEQFKSEGECGFVFTFFTKGHKLVVDVLGQ